MKLVLHQHCIDRVPTHFLKNFQQTTSANLENRSRSSTVKIKIAKGYSFLL